MFEKNLKLSYLLDFYGEVLDEQTRGMMTAYYDDDLSLAEIAEGVGISRQGVRHAIKKGEEQLYFLETRLGLAEHYERLESASVQIGEVIAELKARGGFDNEVLKLSEAADTIVNK